MLFVYNNNDGSFNIQLEYNTNTALNNGEYLVLGTAPINITDIEVNFNESWLNGAEHYGYDVEETRTAIINQVKADLPKFFARSNVGPGGGGSDTDCAYSNVTFSIDASAVLPNCVLALTTHWTTPGGTFIRSFDNLYLIDVGESENVFEDVPMNSSFFITFPAENYIYCEGTGFEPTGGYPIDEAGEYMLASYEITDPEAFITIYCDNN